MAAKLDIALSPIVPRRYPIPLPGEELLELLPLLDPAICLPDMELLGMSPSELIEDSVFRPEPVRLTPQWIDCGWEAKFAMEEK